MNTGNGTIKIFGYCTFTALSASLLLCGCSSFDREGLLGSGIVESQTLLVASTSQGQLSAVYKDEGQSVQAQELVAIIDTVPLTLMRGEAKAGRAELLLTIKARRAEAAAVAIETAGVAREYNRVSPLVANGSVPSQKADELKTRLEALRQKSKAARFGLAALQEKINGLDAKLDQLENQIIHCYVRAPLNGIVLSQLKSAGEVVGPGMPILEIGSLDTMWIDFFVPQPAMATFALGDIVSIRLDTPDKSGKSLDAAIAWVSDEAEFTPKNVQTRESRNQLVFRVRAHAANRDGLLKRGVPVEVWRAKP